MAAPETSPTVSIVIPCRNEEKYIGEVLENILQQSYPKDRLEVWVVDGASTDRTAEVVRAYSRRHSFIHLLENPDRYVPHAMNRGIRAARGDVIVRMDAHAGYPPNYVEELVTHLRRLKADNVGGSIETLPADESRMAQAIAVAVSHPFGVGNSYFRTVGFGRRPRPVDTVPFGCYPRAVFERIGLYDEDLVRNQDDELNARLLRAGGKIYLLPWVRIRYYARRNLRGVAKMFYQYGYFKPLVNLKVGRPATLRQFVPLLFLLGLVLPLMGALGYPPLAWLSVGVLAAHALVNAVVSVRIARRRGQWRLVPYLWVVFLVIHLAYGWGYLRGIVDFLIFRKHRKRRLEAEITR